MSSAGVMTRNALAAAAKVRGRRADGPARLPPSCLGFTSQRNRSPHQAPKPETQTLQQQQLKQQRPRANTSAASAVRGNRPPAFTRSQTQRNA
jgi:hypothetical protein